MEKKTDQYAAQKKYLQTRKRLSVWMDPDKYQQFKDKVQSEGKSIYGVINQFVDDYLKAGE